MADNTTVNTGTAISGATNKTFASDDIGGVQYPRTKITLGADGFNDGDVSSSNPMPISGPVTVSGVATAANQTTGNTSLSSIDGKLPALSGGAVPITGALTDTQLRASAVPVSASTLPLPTGAATESTLSALSAKIPASPATDRTTAAAPFAVRVSDGSAFVSVATSAKQDTGNTSLSSIDSKTPALSGGSVPVVGPITDAQLRASAIAVSGTVTAIGPLTDAQLRATSVPVSGPLTDAQLRATAVPISAASLPLPSGAATDGAAITDATMPTGGSGLSGWLSAIWKAITDRLPAALVGGRLDVNVGNTVTVSGTVAATTGGLTDAQLRAIAVPVSGPLTDAQIRATPLPVSGTVSTGGLTDTQLRATAVPVSGTVAVSGTIPVSGPLTDTQLRATAVPISAAALPLPSGAATAANQTTGNTSLSNIDTKTPALVTGRVPVDGSGVTQPISGNVGVTGSVAVTGPLTDTQIRATPLPVSGTVTATGPLTDAQLRASAVPVSGPLTDTQLRATAVPVSGPVTDAQLRASAVGVTVASSNLTPTRSVATTSSTVSAGAQCVGFKNTGTTTVTLLGQNLLAGESRALSVPYPFKLAAIAYNATGGTLEIVEVR